MTGSASATERVAAYIDGFNLYFGIREKGRRHLWLDLERLVHSLLKPHQQLVACATSQHAFATTPPLSIGSRRT
jgi:hypothetical protein